MADFITRLAERGLGEAPVVQPLIPSVFAPESASHSPALEWETETTTPPGDLARMQVPPVVETPPLRAAKEVREDRTTARREEQDASARITPPSRTLDIPSEPRHPAGPASTERKIMPTRKDQRNLSSAPPERPQRAPGIQPEPRHSDETGPARHDEAVSTSSRELAEGLPSSPSMAESALGQAIPIGTLVEQGRGAALPSALSPGIEASPGTEGSILGSKTAPELHTPSDAPLVAPDMVRPRILPHVERSSQEPGVSAPEPPAPTIRVAIGRIEVRAIMPPPTPPTQQTTPAGPEPAPSLDDYLKQRNGGQR